MRLAGRPEIGLDAEMDLQPRLLEPAAPSHGEVRRLGNLRNPQHALVEGGGARLLPRRHGQLHVVDRDDTHQPRSPRDCSVRCLTSTTWAGTLMSVLIVFDTTCSTSTEIIQVVNPNATATLLKKLNGIVMAPAIRPATMSRPTTPQYRPWVNSQLRRIPTP